jgi:hypothetical protein
MRVDVDCAGHHEHPGSIHDLACRPGRAGQIGRDRLDDPARHGDVAAE